MSTVMTWQTSSISSDDSEQIGEQLGKNLHGGETIELLSDLGGGKTTLVRGMARGIASEDNVASPSFTISRVYKSDDKEIRHFDFYRLHDPGLIGLELQECLDDPRIVTVVEWGAIVENVLPEKRLRISIISTGENTRDVIFHYPKTLAYLLHGIKR